MRCVICNKGKLKEGFTEYKKESISLGMFKANVCTSCGESFFDSDTARKIISKKKGLFELSKKTQYKLLIEKKNYLFFLSFSQSNILVIFFHKNFFFLSEVKESF